MKMTKQNKSVIVDKMERLKSLYKETAESLLEMGKLIVEMIQDDASNYDRIKTELAFNDTMMERFQKIGMGRIHPELILDASPAAGFIEKLSVEDQNKVISSGILVVKNIEDGKINTDTVPYRDLSWKDAQFILGSGQVKTVEQQAEKLKQKLIILPPQPSYEIIGDVIHFHDAKFKLPDLESLVTRLKDQSLAGLERGIKSKQVASA